jgi:hypothetical protein
MPSFVMEGSSVPWVSIALNGWAWSSLAVNQVMRAASLVGGFEKTVVVMTGGTQDLQEGDTELMIINDMQAYAAALRTLGVDKIIVTTITPSVNFDATEESRRQTVNDLLLVADDYDAVVDVASIPELGDHTDLTYYSDGTHLTPVGAQIMGDEISFVLNPILTTL